MLNVFFNAPTRTAAILAQKLVSNYQCVTGKNIYSFKKISKKVVEMPRPCQYPKLRHCVSKTFSFDNAIGQIKKTNLKLSLVPQCL